MIFHNTKLNLALLFVLNLVLITVLTFGVYQIRAENKETSRLLQLSDQTAQREVLNQAIRTLKQGAKGDIETFENFSLSNNSLVPLIESIESAGRALHLDIKTTSVDKKLGGDSSGAQQVQITIEANGSWQGTFSFLKAVESLPNRVMINEVSLTKVDSTWQARITLSIYSFN